MSARRALIISAGVAGMSISLGIVTGVIISAHGDAEVMQALILTAAIVGMMSVAGIAFPKVFEGWGPYLAAGLWVLIAAACTQFRLASHAFPEIRAVPIVNWLGIILFAVYVAYDWTYAAKAPATVENAIRASGLLILDAANIFVRALEVGNPQARPFDSDRHRES
jgi:FtsH-binding integral membrane protein